MISGEIKLHVYSLVTMVRKIFVHYSEVAHYFTTQEMIKCHEHFYDMLTLPQL